MTKKIQIHQEQFEPLATGKYELVQKKKRKKKLMHNETDNTYF